MAEFHNVHTFLYDATAVSRVVSVQWGPMTGALVPRPDGSGANVTLPVANAAFAGSVSFLDQTEAAKFADKVDITKSFTFKAKTSANVDATVTGTVCITGPVRGFSHNLTGSGPYVVDFTAATMSAPT